jgi:sugar lactone lactonase YvrE
VQGGYVAWTEYGNGVNQGSVSVVQADGGGSPMTLKTGLVSPAGVSIGQGLVYVADFGGRALLAVGLDGGSSQFGAFLNSPTSVIALGDEVYYADPGAPLVGFPGSAGARWPDGGAATIYTMAGSPDALAVDATGVFWGDILNNQIVTAVPDGGTRVIFQGDAGSAGVALDAVNVYWTTPSGEVWRAARAGASQPTLLAQGEAGPAAIATDGQSLYFADFANEMGVGTLRKMSVDGGAVTTLSDSGYPNSVALDNQCVYWTEIGSGHISRTDK